MRINFLRIVGVLFFVYALVSLLAWHWQDALSESVTGLFILSYENADHERNQLRDEKRARDLWLRTGTRGPFA